MAKQKKHGSITTSDFDQLKYLNEEGIHQRFVLICGSKQVSYPTNVTRYHVTQTLGDISPHFESASGEEVFRFSFRPS
jgi:hypothetical protein